MRYSEHKEKWCECRECGLCEQRQNVVLARGMLPASVLFVGEAPGESEDAVGEPFVGTSGRLLQYDILPEAQRLAGDFRYIITNLVCCVPWENKLACSVRDPLQEEIMACASRLVEFFHIVKPEIIVALGALSAKWTPRIVPEGYKDLHILKLPHPAAISRIKTITQKLSVIHLCAVRIATCVLALEENRYTGSR